MSSIVNQDRVLILCDDPAGARVFTRLFEAEGCIVQWHTGRIDEVDLNGISAVVHLARSASALNELLEDELALIKDEEWILVEGQTAEDDFHCTVQIMPAASSSLRVFVRTLWAMFTVT